MALTKATFSMIDGASINVRDYGAVGDGLTDDTAALTAAFAAAANNTIPVVGNAGDNYRIASGLTLTQKNFDGRNCTITKDFAGVGITITGGAAYSYLKNFTIVASSGQTATDYSAVAADHGILISATRVEMENVQSNGHKGAGFYADQTGGNMNKCVFRQIRGGANSRAGFFANGNYPTSDNFSVVQFSGYFQSNFGYGFASTATCRVRAWDMWLYAENNCLGASFNPTNPAVTINRGNNITLWAYVETDPAKGTELTLGTDVVDSRITSVRANLDYDSGTDNIWYRGDIAYSRNISAGQQTVQRFLASGTQTTTNGNYLQVSLEGGGSGSDIYGYLRGMGRSAGAAVALVSEDGTKYFAIADDKSYSVSPIVEYGTALVAGQSNQKQIFFDRVTPTANKVTITADFITETSGKFGTGIAEIFLSLNTGSSNSVYYYKGDWPLVARDIANPAVLGTVANEMKAGVTVTSSVSGATVTWEFTLNAAVIEVCGSITMKGGMAKLDSAVLA